MKDIKKKEKDSRKVLDIYTGENLTPSSLSLLPPEERYNRVLDMWEQSLKDKDDLSEELEKNKHEVDTLTGMVNQFRAYADENKRMREKLTLSSEQEKERLQKLEDDKKGGIIERVSLEHLGFRQWEIHRKKICVKCKSEDITVKDNGFFCDNIDVFEENKPHVPSALSNELKHHLVFICNSCKNEEKYGYYDQHPYELALKGIIIDYESFPEEENEQEENNDTD